jgi:hypothetical protein
VLVVYGDVMSMLGAFMPTPIAAEDLRSVALFTDGAAGACAIGHAVCVVRRLGVCFVRVCVSAPRR